MSLFDRAGVDKKLFLILLVASIFANIAVLPYTFSLGLLQFPKPIYLLIPAFIIQAMIMFSIFIFIGLCLRMALLEKRFGIGHYFPLFGGYNIACNSTIVILIVDKDIRKIAKD